MGAKRIVWHVAFEVHLRRKGSRAFEIRAEVPLSTEPPRIDYLLIRKIAEPDTSAQTLRRLWPMLPRVSVVEYKSPGRSYRRGDLDRLWSYVHAYCADQYALPDEGTASEPAPDVRARADLCAVLVVPERTPTLNADAEEQALTWVDLGDGYWKLTGHSFALIVVELKSVGAAERDDLLLSLGDRRHFTREVGHFWAELQGSKEIGMSLQDMEGYKEAIEAFLAEVPPELRLAGLPPELRLAGLPPEQRLAGLPPEQRLAGLAPEQRLAGLDHDHQVLALPLDILRALPESYFATLSAETQAEVRRRLNREP